MTKHTERPSSTSLNNPAGLNGTSALTSKGRPVARLAYQSMRLVKKPAASSIWFLDLRSWQLRTPDMQSIDLTPNEFSFLKMLISVPGNAVQRDSIALALYGRCDYHTSRSLDSLVRRLRIKIKHQSSLMPPIKTAHGIGYIFSAPVDSSQPIPATPNPIL